MRTFRDQYSDRGQSSQVSRQIYKIELQFGPAESVQDRMSSWSQLRVILFTGASDGIGYRYELVRLLARKAIEYIDFHQIKIEEGKHNEHGSTFLKLIITWYQCCICSN